jgi:hypothetical protein
MDNKPTGIPADMTLRDFVAWRVMELMMPDADLTDSLTQENLAQRCYEVADWMLSAREQGQ